MNNQIFVAIPTMNDEEYLPTLERIFALADDPSRVKVGTTILWKESDIPIYGAPFFYLFKKEIDAKYSKNVSYDILPWSQYPGVGHGRLEPLKHYNGEKYFLSLDSHTSFVKGWDTKVIEKYEDSKKHFGKLVVLTTYLPAYFPEWDTSTQFIKGSFSKELDGVEIDKSLNLSYIEGDKFSRWQFFDYTHNLSLDVLENDYIFPLPNDKRVSEKSGIMDKLIDGCYLPAKKISAHFTFTEASPWVTAHMNNISPACFFWSEEFYQSSLAYARGYNLVWIKDPLFFHYYKPKEAPAPLVSNYTDSKSGRRVEEVIEYDNELDKVKIYTEYLREIPPLRGTLYGENETVSRLLNQEEFFGYLPRSPRAFMKYSGINISSKRCSPWWEVPNYGVLYQ